MEGRWLEAEEWKNARIKEYKSAGLKAAEAKEAAWCDMEAEYPALEGEELEAARRLVKNRKKNERRARVTPEVPEAEAKSEGVPQFEVPPRELSHGEVLAWVEEALGTLAAGAEVVDLICPSRGAWGWLQWARGAEDKFRALLTTEARRREENGGVEDGGVSEGVQLAVAEIDEMLAEALESMEGGTLAEGDEVLDREYF
jgi:hypothetical protein